MRVGKQEKNKKGGCWARQKKKRESLKKNEERASKREKKKKLTSWFLKGRRVEEGRRVFCCFDKLVEQSIKREKVEVVGLVGQPVGLLHFLPWSIPFVGCRGV